MRLLRRFPAPLVLEHPLAAHACRLLEALLDARSVVSPRSVVPPLMERRLAAPVFRLGVFHLIVRSLEYCKLRPAYLRRCLQAHRIRHAVMYTAPDDWWRARAWSHLGFVELLHHWCHRERHLLLLRPLCADSLGTTTGHHAWILEAREPRREIKVGVR